MKNFVIIFCILVLFCSNAYAEKNNSQPKEELCPGVWILMNVAGWSVGTESGIILPLSPNTVVLGCKKKPISLYPELAGAKAKIECKPSPLSFGLPDVLAITVICE